MDYVWCENFISSLISEAFEKMPRNFNLIEKSRVEILSAGRMIDEPFGITETEFMLMFINTSNINKAIIRNYASFINFPDRQNEVLDHLHADVINVQRTEFDRLLKELSPWQYTNSNELIDKIGTVFLYEKVKSHFLQIHFLNSLGQINKCEAEKILKLDNQIVSNYIQSYTQQYLEDIYMDTNKAA